MKTILLTNHYSGAPLAIVKSALPADFSFSMLEEPTANCLEKMIADADYLLTHIPLLAGKMKFVISDYKPESPSEIDQTNPNHHRTACATTSGQCHLQSLQASQLSSRLKASFPCLSFISNFKEKLFFFKYELVKPGSRRCFEQMQKDQFLPPDEIEELNWKRTHALLQQFRLRITT